MHRVMRRALRRAVAHVWQAWYERAEHAAAVSRRCRLGVSRFVHSQVSAALLTWRDATASQAEAEAAAEALNHTELLGLPCRFHRDRGSADLGDTSVGYIRIYPLDPEITERNLFEVLGAFGAIDDCFAAVDFVRTRAHHQYLIVGNQSHVGEHTVVNCKYRRKCGDWHKASSQSSTKRLRRIVETTWHIEILVESFGHTSRCRRAVMLRGRRQARKHASTQAAQRWTNKQIDRHA